MTPVPGKLLTAAQAAAYLGFSTDSIRRWSDEGHIAVIRTPGNQRRFREQDLDNFMASLKPDKPKRRRQ
jgi:excisionase family DNA binding protein